MCVNALAFLITSSCLPPPVSRDQPDQLHASVDACVDEFCEEMFIYFTPASTEEKLD